MVKGVFGISATNIPTISIDIDSAAPGYTLFAVVGIPFPATGPALATKRYSFPATLPYFPWVNMSGLPILVHSAIENSYIIYLLSNRGKLYPTNTIVLPFAYYISAIRSNLFIEASVWYSKYYLLSLAYALPIVLIILRE